MIIKMILRIKMDVWIIGEIIIYVDKVVSDIIYLLNPCVSGISYTAPK